jgi:hypothetical protein
VGAARRLHPLKRAPPSATPVSTVTKIGGMPPALGRIILIGGVVKPSAQAVPLLSGSDRSLHGPRRGGLP